MSSYWGILLSIVLILVWIIAGGYITQANIKIRGFEGNDDFFKKANNYAFWAAFITWFLVALFILLIILAIVGVIGLFSTGAGEAEEAEVAVSEEQSATSKLYKQYQNSQQNESEGISWSTIIFLFFAFILVGITGVLGALAADQLKQSHLFTETNPDMIIAYDNCIITAIICLGVDGLLIIALIFYLFIVFFETNKINDNISTNNVSTNNVNTNNVSTNNVSTIPGTQINNQSKLASDFKKGKIIKL